MLSVRSIIWGVAAFLFVAFFVWYTDLRGPLTESEISDYLATMEVRNAPTETVARLKNFMEEDTGRQFFMLNALDMADNPPDVPGAAPGETADQLMARYMEHMYAELFRRACHPTIIGSAVAPAMDLVGVDGLSDAEDWTVGGFMRYRSRRSFMEIVTIPETSDRHDFKIAALDKTIAYPIEAGINLGDPRWLLGLVLLTLASLLDRLFVRSK